MRVLVVEDNKSIQNILKYTLEKEYYVVDIAENGKTARELLNTNPYVLSIFDINLPDTTGLTLCHEARQKFDSLYIIMLTVRQEIAAKTHAFNHGADDYIVKPFSFDNLHARIRALLRRPRLTKENHCFTFKNFILNTLTCTLTWKNNEVTLTPREFALLWHLVEREGALCTRLQILSHVWSMAADPISNTVEVHIQRLRKKLERIEPQRMIHTVPGHGYFFKTSKPLTL